MKRHMLAAAVAALLPVLVGFVWPGTVEWLCTRGVKQYNAGQFLEAGESFARAREYAPDSPALAYNQGTALYGQERYDEATEAFSAAAQSGDSGLARDSAYNIGNSRFTAGDFGAAIEAYKQALRTDPSDMDARHNLELAQKKQQQQQQRQQQKQQQERQQQQEQQEQQQQEQQQQEQQQQEQQQQASEDQLSREQAQRLLHALASEDAEMQKLIRRQPQRLEPSEGAKDW